MLPQPNNIRSGDLYIFEDDEIVGVVGGIKFQQIPRRVMDKLIPPRNLSKQSSTPPTTKPTIEMSSTLTKALTTAKTTPHPSRIEEPTVLVTALPSLVAKIMKIIASETDVNMIELVDDAAFENLGVDSLMSLTICADFREQLELEIPSSLFFDYPTVGKMKSFFSQYETASTSTAENNSGSSSSDAFSMIEDNESQTPNSAPSEVSDDLTSDGLRKLSYPGRDDVATPHRIFAEKLHISIERPLNVTPQPPEASSNLIQTPPSLSSCSRATSFLLQGNPKTATQILLLFPDGSGSASSYINIPPLSRYLAVYGLNCPFMKTPHKFLIGIPEVCALYLNEMRRRQPIGPYHIGGWSAGGVVAYEVALQVLAAGETVEKLLLIDSPCPVALAPLPSSLFCFFDQIGLLGSGGIDSSPDWLIPHFEASVKALADYEPAPMPAGRSPDTVAIWARDGVCGKSGGLKRPQVVDGEEPPTMKWLLDDRVEFGDNGWGQLFGRAVRCVIMEGNHFTMMKPQHGAALGRLIQQALDVESDA